MNIISTFHGMDVSDALKEYFEEKLNKYESLLTPATSISVIFHQSVSTKGVKSDFKIDINIVLPNALVRVEEKGPDMYALIDSATDVLARRLNRYLDKRTNWDGVTPWSELEALGDLDDDDDQLDNYIDYIPKISLRRKMEFNSPMSEAEAIERMELLGKFQILFKNVTTGLLTMIYKDTNGQYILVEPKEEL